MDVFGSGLAGSPSPSTNQQGSPLLGAKAGTGIGMGLQQPNMGMGLQQPIMGMGQQPVIGMGLQQPVVNADPLTVLNDLHVSMDSIQPGMTRLVMCQYLEQHTTFMHIILTGVYELMSCSLCVLNNNFVGVVNS